MAFFAAIAALLGGGLIYLYNVYGVALAYTDWHDVVTKHFAAIAGLPAAAASSFAILVFLRQMQGPIEFGFKLHGASGAVVLWVLCFMAMGWAIRLCW